MNQRTIYTGARELVLGAIALLLFAFLVPVSAHAQSDSQYIVRVDEGYLALRTAPAYDDSNVVGKLYTGDIVSVEKKPRGEYWWVYSPELDKSGYVNKDYLMTATSFGDCTVKVDTGYLALRTAPAYDDGNIIGELYTGDVVTVKAKPDGQYWWVYSPKYDECGYVNKDNLVTAVSPYGEFTVQVDKGYLALRTAPSYDDDNVIGELYTGDVVSVEEKRAGGYWWVYSPKYNREGYVNSDYLVRK